MIFTNHGCWSPAEAPTESTSMSLQPPCDSMTPFRLNTSLWIFVFMTFFISRPGSPKMWHGAPLPLRFWSRDTIVHVRRILQSLDSLLTDCWTNVESNVEVVWTLITLLSRSGRDYAVCGKAMAFSEFSYNHCRAIILLLYIIVLSNVGRC